MGEKSRDIPKKKKKRRSVAPFFCHLFGMLMLALTIACCLPVTLPRLMGYQIYQIVSGSMEPVIPVNSVVYVKPVDPLDVQKGDIIAFTSGNSVVVHRVVENWNFEGTFTTKGDANEQEDLVEIPYDSLIGVVTYHVKVLGQLVMVLTSNTGRVLVICFAASGALFNILGGRLTQQEKDEEELDL